MVKILYQIHRFDASQKSRKNKKISWPQTLPPDTLQTMISVQVQTGPKALALANEFDLQWDGSSTFDPWPVPDVPKTYGLGLIVGPSGTGKSILLQHFGTPAKIDWNPSYPIASHFATPQNAHEKLSAAGLNSVPTWLKPYHVLSTGEKFRADLARRLRSGAVLDEYTSVVDRKVAATTSIALRRYIDRQDLKNITIATCHFDIIRQLEPDWIFNTTNGVLDARGRVPRTRITIDVYRCSWRTWPLFGKYHYLSHKLHKQAQCFVGLWEGHPVVFTAVLAFPHPTIKKAFREHRTVVLPDYQGAGIGTQFSDAIAQLYIDTGRKYYSRTSHPSMGEYRNRSPLWKPTRTNQRRQTRSNPDTSIQDHWTTDTKRLCYSHQYVGKSL